MGRPLKPIDAEQVYKLARLGCTQEEIADFFSCHPDTIRDRFSSEIASARAAWKMSLRRAQTVRAVRDRSDSMLIHLGKSHLGQGERIDVTTRSQPIFEAFDDGRDPDLPPPAPAA
jgi:hypothetical protein